MAFTELGLEFGISIRYDTFRHPVSRKIRLPIPMAAVGKLLYTSCVVGKSKVCIGGLDGYAAIIQPPKGARYIPGMFMVLIDQPFKKAFIRGSLTLATACYSTLTKSGCSRSIQECCCAHSILVHAVRESEVPGNVSFKGQESYRWKVLYSRAASFV